MHPDAEVVSPDSSTSKVHLCLSLSANSISAKEHQLPTQVAVRSAGTGMPSRNGPISRCVASSTRGRECSKPLVAYLPVPPPVQTPSPFSTVKPELCHLSDSLNPRD